MNSMNTMYTPKKLFLNRLKDEWFFNYKVFKTSLDWTIGLYIIIPLILIGFYNYYSLWNASYDLDFTSLYITVYILLYLFTLTGDIRSFLKFGDQLYLRQKEGWIIELLNLGLIYTLIISMISSTLIFLLLAPFLLVYLKISLIEFIVLFLFIYIYRLVQMYLKQFISLYFTGWKRILVYLIALVISFFIYGYLFFYLNQILELIIAILLIIILFYQLHSKKLKIKWSLYEDSVREQNQKIKYAKYLLEASSYFNGPVIKKKKKSKKPWLFRNSATLFRKRSSINSLIELNIKIILRSRNNIFALLQITSVFIYGLTITDNWLKLSVLLFYILIILKYFKDNLKESQQSLLLKLYPIKNNLRTKANQLSIFYISMPGILLTSLITGYDLFSFYLGLILMFIGIIISYFAVKIIVN